MELRGRMMAGNYVLVYLSRSKT